MIDSDTDKGGTMVWVTVVAVLAKAKAVEAVMALGVGELGVPGDESSSRPSLRLKHTNPMVKLSQVSSKSHVTSQWLWWMSASNRLQ